MKMPLPDHLPSRAEMEAILRTDFNAFVERCFFTLNESDEYSDNFHVAVICAELMAMERGETQRLAIALPPRSLKSIVVSVAYVAWLLGHKPSLKIVCASYGQQLSDQLASDCRKIMMSDWYQRLFPGTRFTHARPALANMVTTAGGSRRSTSVGGSITGLGADYFVVDDPTKPEEAFSDIERVKVNHWGAHTMLTRLNHKVTARVIIVMQRLHEDDLFGHMTSLIPMKQLVFPAIAQRDEQFVIRTAYGTRHHLWREGEALHPEREPLELLEEYRAALGEQFFSAQFLQMPAPPGGSLVDPRWFPRYDLTSPPAFDEVVQSWDTASTDSDRSDYSVCTTWGRAGKRYFLLHVLRKRLKYPDLKRAVIEQARLFDANVVLIEETAAGFALVQQFQQEGFHRARSVKPKGDKFARMRAETAIIEAGLVFLPDQAPWLEAYLHELMLFPVGRYDDQVDSTSQALAYLRDDNGADAWVQYMGEQAGNVEGPVFTNSGQSPYIVLNCTDLNAEVHVGGRVPKRQSDGSFLVNDDEYQGAIQLPGVYRPN